MSILFESIVNHWPVWLVTVVLIVAAVIDGMILKVPNWLTFSLIVTGWIYCTLMSGWSGLGWSLVGTLVGFLPLLILRSVGGMGGGDVKLLGGVGAWLGPGATWNGFLATTIVGGIMALIMIGMSGRWNHHWVMAKQIIREWLHIRNPEKIAAIARERKPTMRLLPYGIPMAIGCILYFGYAGMLG
jgi:prepilin peptidase CpaA